jgi:hypothetical protein
MIEIQTIDLSDSNDITDIQYDLIKLNDIIIERQNNLIDINNRTIENQAICIDTDNILINKQNSLISLNEDILKDQDLLISNNNNDEKLIMDYAELISDGSDNPDNYEDSDDVDIRDELLRCQDARIKMLEKIIALQDNVFKDLNIDSNQ